MSDKKTPAIRFPGFTDAWEQRKLGDIATFINGRAYSQEELLSSGKYKVLRVGNFYTNDSWYYSDLELDDKYYAEEGDLLYTWSATFGPHIWHGEKVIYHYHIWKVELSEHLEKQFAVHLLEQDKAAILSDKNGSTMVHITKAGMEGKSVLIPKNVNEQAKIGAYLDELDNLITLHQRKCDKLKEYKKGCLQKMFPKDGADVPEVRFPGFTDAWEQRKFDKWGDFYYGRSCPKWSVTEDATIPCIRYGELYTKFGAKIDRVYSYTNMSPEKLRFSKGTEVLIPRVGEDPMDYNHCTWLSLKNVAIGEMISVFNTDQDPLFSATMFNATLQKEFAVRVEGGSVTNLYFDKLRNIDVSYPSLPEQRRIAGFFENIDSLITLHQRKFETMKKKKKSLLQKMFV